MPRSSLKVSQLLLLAGLSSVIITTRAKMSNSFKFMACRNSNDCDKMVASKCDPGTKTVTYFDGCNKKCAGQFPEPCKPKMMEAEDYDDSEVKTEVKPDVKPDVKTEGKPEMKTEGKTEGKKWKKRKKSKKSDDDDEQD